ncbi:Pyruvate/Phosphoenolpyruvate kinase-like domain containing protein [Parasponia andersonii]|uniref:Pyruvate/Phosphoenolpyruvate kinase-like domain containing protein n=1 Tax=Parasponia andersonii TaxID=3476 RepID=A0A2P5D0T8_PARAD|nr:Pyruvate/Phosphoenolpyruvate kinase-like domain containing protein [Parasponia andersonii]
MVEQGRLITKAVSIPIIRDADTGYGNAMNVKRTVKGFIKAGFAGIMLEDQEGGVKRGGSDARRESGSNTVIVARTDSRQMISFGESLWRAMAFADAGADDALMAIKGGQIPPPRCRPCFEELNEILSFNTYYEEEKRYTNRSQLSSQKELIGYNNSVMVDLANLAN